MPRRRWLIMLVLLNLGLAAGLVLRQAEPRTALAQPAGGLGDRYLLVTGLIQNDFDALYVIDTKERTLHTFTFRKGTRELEYGGYRLLDRDLRHNRD